MHIPSAAHAENVPIALPHCHPQRQTVGNANQRSSALISVPVLIVRNRRAVAQERGAVSLGPERRTTRRPAGLFTNPAGLFINPADLFTNGEG
jgi:hypothetical protein